MGHPGTAFALFLEACYDLRMSKITEAEALEWKRQYEEDPDATIESLALDNGISLPTMRKWLKKVNTKMRPPNRKGCPGQKRNQATDGIKGKSNRVGLKQVGLVKNYTGHRRGKRL